MAEPMDRICLNFQGPLPIFPSLALRQLRHTGTGRDEFCPREGSSSDRRNKRVEENRHFFEWSHLNSEHYVEIGTKMGFI